MSDEASMVPVAVQVGYFHADVVGLVVFGVEENRTSLVGFWRQNLSFVESQFRYICKFEHDLTRTSPIIRADN